MLFQSDNKKTAHRCDRSQRILDPTVAQWQSGLYVAGHRQSPDGIRAWAPRRDSVGIDLFRYHAPYSLGATSLGSFPRSAL
jgi:hypothetical protein